MSKYNDGPLLSVCFAGDDGVGTRRLIRRIKTGTYSSVIEALAPIDHSLIYRDIGKSRVRFSLGVQLAKNFFGIGSLNPHTHAFVVCFDMRNERYETKQLIRKFIQRIESQNHPRTNPMIMLLGHNSESPKQQWTPSALAELHHEFGVRCYTASAKTGEGVEALLQGIGKQLLTRSPAKSDRKKKTEKTALINSHGRFIQVSLADRYQHFSRPHSSPVAGMQLSENGEYRTIRSAQGDALKAGILRIFENKIRREYTPDGIRQLFNTIVHSEGDDHRAYEILATGQDRTTRFFSGLKTDSLKIFESMIRHYGQAAGMEPDEIRDMLNNSPRPSL